MQLFNKKWFVYVIILIAGGLSGCNVTKHLDTDKGERLLTKNSLVFKSEKKVSLSESTSLKYEMGGLFRQQPNSKILGTHARLAAWYKIQGKTSKGATWVEKKVAEKPVIYDEELAKQTAENFKNFIAQRGYFKAKCTFETKKSGKYKAKTTYTLDFGPRYEVAEVNWTSRDTNMVQLFPELKKDSRIKPGIPVDIRQFDAEKQRITVILKEKGYARFFPGYIEFNGDSTDTRVNINVNILPQNDTTNHQKYIIGNVAVFSSLVPDVSAIRLDSLYKGIKYFSNEQKFFIKPKHLDRLIQTRPNMLFQQSNIDLTNRKLASIGAFNFVSVKPQPDSVRKEVMNMDIFFSPADKMSMGFAPDFNYSSSTSISGLLGIATTGFIKHRNLFRGAELLQVDLTGNMEFDISKPNNPIFSQEIKFQNNLIIPRFFDYFGVWRGMHGLKIGNRRLISNQFYNRLKNDGVAGINLAYDYLQLNDFYKYNAFNASFGYKFSKKNQRKYEITHLGINLLKPQLDDSICIRNPFLCLSFSNQLFTGFLLRSFTYSYYSNQNRVGERWTVHFNSDVSGAEVELYSKLIQKKIIGFSGLEFARYLRGEISGSYSRNFTKDLFAGIRISSGVIQPFGPSISTPYVKQFFVGGPSSIRGWRIRELGPGSFFDPKAKDYSSFYNSGDFKFEFNSEVRFPVFWWFKGAIFLDGGNVWSLRPETARPGSELTVDSYKNFALSAGAGLRFDFGYSVIRFDLGMKIRYPYTLENGSYWVSKGATWKETSNWNLAVGYPF